MRMDITTLSLNQKLHTMFEFTCECESTGITDIPGEDKMLIVIKGFCGNHGFKESLATDRGEKVKFLECKILGSLPNPMHG
jgi:hypothetical protein